MKSIIIAGAGGFGRDALELIKQVNKIEKRWEIKGFIDDNLNALEGKKCDFKILGTIKDWMPSENEVFVIGISSPKGKEKIANILKARGAKFETIIAPGAIVSEFAQIGEGSIITNRTSIGAGTVIGNFVHVASSSVGNDAVIGDYSTTTAFTNLTNATIGKRVFVGSHSVIMNKLKVGDDAYICVGSIVIRNVKAGTKVWGYPAKVVDF